MKQIEKDQVHVVKKKVEHDVQDFQAEEIKRH